MNKSYNFTSIEELRNAKRILYSKKAALELDMKDELDSLKDSLSPAKILSRIVNAGSHSHNGSHDENATSNNQGLLFGAGAAVTDLLVNDLFLRKSGYIKKFVMSYVIRLFAPTLFQYAGPLFKNLFNKAKAKV